jgi:hypothetical protein
MLRLAGRTFVFMITSAIISGMGVAIITDRGAKRMGIDGAVRVQYDEAAMTISGRHEW